MHSHLYYPLKRMVTGRTPWVYLYVFLIPLVNWSFAHVPTVPMPDGGSWSPMAIVTGLILVVRDVAQREVGHAIFFPWVIGITFSFFMAPPEIALASAAAFAISEFIDWAIFTITKRPLSKRILWSCAASAPVDSLVFLLGANAAIPGIFSWLTLATSVGSKLSGTLVIYLLLKRREAKFDDKALDSPLPSPPIYAKTQASQQHKGIR